MVVGTAGAWVITGMGSETTGACFISLRSKLPARASMICCSRSASSNGFRTLGCKDSFGCEFKIPICGFPNTANCSTSSGRRFINPKSLFCGGEIFVGRMFWA
eukprot:TRINITY_DN10432_c0_g1_i1.p1 TRINITY_DN10432_c0_g1~~TRINITY_DN10432_c0_g1_i1.p1  ORF type:complete len:103 (-),score=7.07 TRINITY_DN10432_c0_g1_i1:562-870(-)